MPDLSPPAAVPESEAAAARSRLPQIDAAAEAVCSADSDLASWAENYHRHHRSRLAHDLALCDRLADRGAKLLEVGSAPFFLTKALADSGYGVTGLDLDPGRFGGFLGRSGLDVRRCDIEREPLPFGDGEFGTVLCNEVFEHLRINLPFTFRELLRVTAPGGLLLLSTPNLLSWAGLHQLVRDGRAGTIARKGIYSEWEKLSTIGHMGHVREYTALEVAEFLEAVGFKVEGCLYRGGLGAGGLRRIAYAVRPSLRPLFSLSARKPAAVG